MDACTDQNGNVIVTGIFTSSSIFDTYTLTSNGATDFYVVKYDPVGNIIWSKSFGASSDDRSQKISTDSLNNIFISGTYKSDTLNLGSSTLINSGQEDVFILKLDPAGNTLWAKSCNGSGQESATITTDIYGNCILAGYYTSPVFVVGTQSLTNTSAGNAFIAKYDGNGNFQWARNSKGSGLWSDGVSSVATDNAGNSIILGIMAGTTTIFDNDTLTNNNSIGDSFLVKYDKMGNIIFVKKIPDCSGQSVTTFNNDIYVAGSPSSSLITKYDSQGNLMWNRSFNGGDVRNISSYACGIFITYRSATSELSPIYSKPRPQRKCALCNLSC